VTATQSMILTGGEGPASYVQIGHGGAMMGAGATGLAFVNSGSIAVTVGSPGYTGTLVMNGGYGALSYVQIGHRGPLSRSPALPTPDLPPRAGPPPHPPDPSPKWPAPPPPTRTTPAVSTISARARPPTPSRSATARKGAPPM